MAFVAVGLLGLWATVARRPGTFAHPWDRWPYAVLFAGVTLSSVGSSYFHLAPDNARHLRPAPSSGSRERGLYPAPGTGFLVAGLAAYAAAKGLELADREIVLALAQRVSGHTLKHLVAAGGVGCIVAMLRARTVTRGI